MKVTGRWWVIFFVTVCIFLARMSFATIYKYTDKKGTVCYTNDETMIPEEYRDKIVVIREKEEGISSSEVIDKSQPVRQGMPLHKRLVISAFVFVGFLVIRRVLSRLLSDRRGQIMSWVRIGLGGFFLLYLVAGHGRDVVRAFGVINDKVSSLQAESKEEGRKAAEAAKMLKDLLDRSPDEVEKEPGR